MKTNTYFGRLFKADKLLFSIIFLFFLFSILSNLIRLQTTPFFIWDMYSKEIPSQPYYSFLEIKYNDTSVINFRHTWNEPAKTMLYDPLKTYFSIKANHSISPEETYFREHWLKKHPAFANSLDGLYITRAELDEFPFWLKRYLSGKMGTPVGNISVIARKLQFGNDGDLKLIGSDTILFIK